MADDLRAEIEALCAEPFIYRLDNGHTNIGTPPVVLVSDLEALLAAHPVQDEEGHAVAFGEIGTPCLNCGAPLAEGERAEYVGRDDECDGSVHITCPTLEPVSGPTLATEAAHAATADAYEAGRSDALSPVQVTTAEELDVLPVGSVVLDHYGDAFQKGRAGDWWAPGEELSMTGVLPADVLYRPETP